MNRKIITCLGLAFLGLLSARAESFVRPSFYYVHPVADGASDSTAVGVVLGNTMGAELEHEFSLEVMFTSWEDSRSNPHGYISGTQHVLPIMVNYRYNIGSLDARVRPYVGAGAGVTDCWIDGNGQYGTDKFNVHAEDWTFSYTAIAGVVLKLGKGIDLDLGYRWFGNDGVSYSYANKTFESPSGNAHMGYAAVTLSF